ncbi:hypothetical protein EDB83DRAFT_2609704 [Lactarius deliciosus]|nr:hypothetical protein EDB83DRAFT_2609704 [Lactarius deliciosus]
MRKVVACLVTWGAFLTVAGVLILAPELAREGGKGLRNVEESRNEDCDGDETEREVETSRSTGGSKRGKGFHPSRGIDEAKEGVTSGTEEAEPVNMTPGGRCGGVEWGEMGTVINSSGAGRMGKGSCSDDMDLNGCGELSGMMSAARTGVEENSSSRSPSTRDGDADAGGKSLDAGRTRSKMDVEGDGARFAEAVKGSSPRLQHDSPGDGRRDGSE